MHDHFYAVILAGGGGTRLWPRSRRSRPKQFLDLAGEETMLQAAYARIAPILPPERVLVITNVEYTETVQQQLPALPAHNIVGEPAGRGTAPAIGLAAILLQRRDPAAIMAVLTADHLISRQETFRRVLLATARVAATPRRLVTLSITPTFAETGYGYVERGEEVDRVHGFVAYRVQRFTEKPNRQTAERFVASGRYAWNSGMFIWHIDSILDEMARQMPTLRAHLATIAAALGTPDEAAVFAAVWPQIRAETIDFGIMEGARDVVTLPVDIGWNDVGSWAALADELPANEEGNVVHGPHVLIDTHDSFIFSDGRLIATIGLDNMIVVDTRDALLICPRSRAQDVKKVTEALKERGLNAYLEGVVAEGT